MEQNIATILFQNGNLSCPFPVAFVKHTDGTAHRLSHHIAQIMGLPGKKRYDPALCESTFGSGKIKSGV
ncbi:hypothetical protein GKA01_13010 [Gluconobacter kanchanaburiensis NBRC 103587]|uniref:Uncharacterized protein n=1 Tax=Gluconobacter kanchanaburiensis NBRC 103587 TaxID=1307948 RepID=A0A511B6X0_9PROT|nr:hypothetical protein AA103587_1366 [Gluconobacter kanchanaburiensis NBRC 103587]GEK96104.1 hypothetical protein GKA01_13010 [Gluconobacter kanchanaburiensis NBRC 103587]